MRWTVKRITALKRTQLHGALDRLQTTLVGEFSRSVNGDSTWQYCPWVPTDVRESVEELRTLIDHGSRSHYVKGCRHPACVAAANAYDRARKHKRTAEFLADLREATDED